MIHPYDSLAFIHRRGTSYTMPIDVMRPMAALLMRRGSTNAQALADALAAEADPARAVQIAETLLKATHNNARKAI